ncbi:hypothetical protein FGG08_006330 [Glutinoglossum americanum]|uniref:Amino acid permease/ SLC12A domain-containing protein n=1 Tax=Glutinoglossum americanum TaxID=1670608 RepID=A0A9P8I5H4_9PEZI|nr:hypothetical protein FGG08_006330 [Glutinoglossum americanum]
MSAHGIVVDKSLPDPPPTEATLNTPSTMASGDPSTRSSTFTGAHHHDLVAGFRGEKADPPEVVVGMRVEDVGAEEEGFTAPPVGGAEGGEQLSTIGIGIFLTCGKILHDAGPGGAILAYVLTGTVIWSVIASLGEMTALMPVKSPITEFATRYIDNAVGFATGWMYWFGYVCVFAAQITASSSLMAFNYDKVIVWSFGADISPVLWIFIFLIYMTGTNLLPVRYYGEYEYFCGCVKMVTITGLILLMVIITNGSYWKGHWSGFFSRSFSRSAFGQTFVYEGDKGRLLGLWSGMTTAIFSYIGMDIVAATAAETKFQGNSESIKMATRKISLRILLLYFFAIVTVSFPVAYDDPHLLVTNHGLKSGASSPFMIAIYNAGIPVLPHILNAFFIFSSSSAGINALYVASRTLHALAVSGRVWEGPVARRLRLTKFGVPMVAVLGSASFGLLAFMSTKAQPAKYMRAVYAFVGCSLFIFFNGWDSFLGGRATADKFLPAYISIFVFLILIFLFKLNAGTWRRQPTMHYEGAQEVPPQERRGWRRVWEPGTKPTEKILAFLRDWII